MIGHFSSGGSNVITFGSHNIDKYLYLQLQRGHKGYVIHEKDQVVINFLFQIFCDNKIQQILQERQMLLW